MKIYISSFVVVTDKVIDFIETSKANNEEFLLVLTDAGNPILSDGVREDWLINSSGYKELPIEAILHNEDSVVEFSKAINELVKKNKASHVTFESFYYPEDLEKIKLKKMDVFENDLKGDLLVNHKEYLDKANHKWKSRYGNRFVEIITSTQYSKESEVFGFVLVTDVESVDSEDVKSTATYLSLAKDIDRHSFFAPSTHVESFDLVPLFIDIMEENFGFSVLDYHFRTFVEKGISNRIVFLMTDNDEKTIDVLFGEKTFEVNEYSDLITLPKEQAFIAGGIGSWASLMIDDIRLEESIIDE